MSKLFRFGAVASFCLLATQASYGHGPRYYYGYGGPAYVPPRVVVAPPPPPTTVVIAPAPVPAYATRVYTTPAAPVPAYAPPVAQLYTAPVYVAQPVPVYTPPPPMVTYGAAVGPRGHVGLGYSSPGFGFYFGR